MIMNNVDYEVGDLVQYKLADGRVRTVYVEEKRERIKNGRPGFIGTCMKGDIEGSRCWGYDDQVIRVVN